MNYIIHVKIQRLFIFYFFYSFFFKLNHQLHIYIIFHTLTHRLQGTQKAYFGGQFVIKMSCLCRKNAVFIFVLFIIYLSVFLCLIYTFLFLFYTFIYLYTHPFFHETRSQTFCLQRSPGKRFTSIKIKRHLKMNQVNINSSSSRNGLQK